MVRFIFVSSLILVALVFGGIVIFEKYFFSPPPIKFGVTFSPQYAQYLGLDWRKTYLQMLGDLNVKNLRIPTYWDILQPDAGGFDFSETDFMLNEAEAAGAKVILVLGARQPRWPECHVPDWARALNTGERQQRLLDFIQNTVERYKNYPNIWAWQIENEPLLAFFGTGCDAPDKDFLKKEVGLVRSLSGKTIIMTDSGELGLWKTSMQLSDVFGTTMYRKVFTKSLGYLTYPWPPYFYKFKSDVIRGLFARNNQKTIIIEFQAEPWLADGILLRSDQQASLLTVDELKDYMTYVKKTGFNEAYLWGVEWWYFMAQQGYPGYLEFAKNLFR